MDHEQGCRWGRGGNGRPVGQEIATKAPHERRNLSETVEAADEHRADDAWLRLTGQQRSQVGTGVLAEEHQLIGIDSKVPCVASNERDGRADIREGVFESRQPAQAVVDREPVVACACQKLENLSDMRDSAAR